MKKLLIYLTVLFSLGEGGNVIAQINIDSLQTLRANVSLPDSSRSKAIAFLIQQDLLVSRNYDSAKVKLDELKVLTQKMGDKKWGGILKHFQAKHEQFTGNLDTSLLMYNQSLKLFINENFELGMAVVYNSIGNNYSDQNNKDSSIANYEKALAIYEKMNLNIAIVLLYGNIGGEYVFNDQPAKGLHYSFKAIQYSDEKNFTEIVGPFVFYNYLNGIYHQISSGYLSISDWEKAAYYTKKSNKAGRGFNDNKNFLISDYIQLAFLYMEANNLDSASVYAEKVLELTKNNPNEQAEMVTSMIIGACYSKKGDVLNAEKKFQIATTLGQKLSVTLATSLLNLYMGEHFVSIKNYKEASKRCESAYEDIMKSPMLFAQKKVCDCLYESYKNSGFPEKAIAINDQLIALNDSIEKQDMNGLMQQLELERLQEVDSTNQAEEARLVLEVHKEEMRAEEKKRNIALGAGGLLLLLAGGFYSRMRYIRKSRANLQVEKDRSENLLLNILPEEIAQELKIYGKAEARDFDLVSILFTDFKGFTQASAKLSAADLVNEINHCFEAFDGIMEKYGIEKIKTIGDAYMAAGGLPVPTDNSVKNTVLAALEMQDFIEQRHKTKVSRGESAFEMRVGINTGPVVAGIVGVKKFQYDIWGDTVNTASRMESSGEIGKVNISQATYELLKNDSDFAFESRGKIEAKGKGEIAMYFVMKRS